MALPLTEPRPIFIVGAGRSGTSALTWALGQHDNIIACPETEWLVTTACYLSAHFTLGSAAPGTSHMPLFGVTWADYAHSAGIGADHLVRSSFEHRFPDRHTPGTLFPGQSAYRKWYRSHAAPKSRWVNGTPSLTAYGRILAAMFPEALFIHLLRDPPSVLRSHLAAPWMAHQPPVELLHFVYHSVRVGHLLEACLPDGKVLRVAHDRLAQDRIACLEQVFEFIGEDFSPAAEELLRLDRVNVHLSDPDEVAARYTAVCDSPYLAELEKWHVLSQDPDWRILDPQTARIELHRYESCRLPLPDPTAAGAPQ